MYSNKENVNILTALLVRHGVWKYEYAKCIDEKKIKEEWCEE